MISSSLMKKHKVTKCPEAVCKAKRFVLTGSTHTNHYQSLPITLAHTAHLLTQLVMMLQRSLQVPYNSGQLVAGPRALFRKVNNIGHAEECSPLNNRPPEAGIGSTQDLFFHSDSLITTVSFEASVTFLASWWQDLELCRHELLEGLCERCISGHIVTYKLCQEIRQCAAKIAVHSIQTNLLLYNML